MTTVLVVEPDAAEAESLVSLLRRHGYQAAAAQTGTQALRTYRTFGLVLVSLDLADVDGLAVCRAIRSVTDTPLIARSRRDDAMERVLAMRDGADDCVAAAWGFRELAARIDAVLRRHTRAAATEPPSLITIEPLVLDARSQEVQVGGEAVDLTAKEFELLYALAADPGAVRTRRELMAEVWGSDWGCTSRTIDTHVSSLRAKLGSARSIITVRGVGYRIGQFEASPMRLSS